MVVDDFEVVFDLVWYFELGVEFLFLCVGGVFVFDVDVFVWGVVVYVGEYVDDCV